ncbi:phosphatidylinositol N-acetylglucosaminyltransferase subunit P-like [Triticum dicoccoides]|uniref:phosphatidylinositol N-acetylglucosaminyltransferase subunit P-like n=1 Tax=Triticum dicoccoides TaxID=85692 RepID=UPI00188E97DB|nr:phosphatidylinositol N-acetylglucosaminyltransferase subunit P-like [Triticum dicoccoides]
MDPSASASLVVRSPRQTVSLLRSRRPQFGRPERERGRERNPPRRGREASGPKPSEVYGFVGSITVVTATAVYLAWAYAPEPALRSLGITYYPTKYWALAVPSLAMVALALSLLAYLGSNFVATPPPTSFSTIFDEYSRERPGAAAAVHVDAATAQGDEEEEEAERPIEPISDISIHHINNLMFGDH